MKEEEPNREQQTPLDDEEQIAEAVELSYGMRLAGDRAEPSAKTDGSRPQTDRSLEPEHTEDKKQQNGGDT